MDIMIRTDKDEEVDRALRKVDKSSLSDEYSLSRTFCNFMCRRNAVEHEPELDQIGRIYGIDIQTLYLMEEYPDEEGLEFELEYAMDDAHRERILQRLEEQRNETSGNLENVLSFLEQLITRLSQVPNLAEVLESADFDTPYGNNYFADFNKEQTESYPLNNFGQDLRNIQRYLTLSKEYGATTAWFEYG